MENIKIANETLYKRVGKEDPFLIYLINDFIPKYKSLATDYYINKKLTEDDLKIVFETLSKEFNKEAFNRFGIVFKPKLCQYFATIPIFNTDNTQMIKLNEFKNKNVNREIKAATRKAIEFYKWLEAHTLYIDRKKIKVLNLPKDFYVYMYMGLTQILELTVEETAAVILHEIGHVFTFFEFYNKTANYTTRLTDAIINEKDIPDIFGLTIKKDDIDDANIKDMFIRIYEKLGEGLFKETLGGNEAGFADTEYDADQFVVLFDMGGPLASALRKLSDIDLGVSKLLGVLTIVMLFESIFLILGFALFMGGAFFPALICLALISLFINTIIVIVNSVSKRNSVEDEHGDLHTRLDNIKRNLIMLLRKYDMDKKDKENIIKQIEQIDALESILNKSGFGKFITGLFYPQFGPSLHIEERLSRMLYELINNDLYYKTYQILSRI